MVELLRRLAPQLRGLFLGIKLCGRATVQQGWVERPVEEVVRVITAQKCQGLRHSLHLRRERLMVLCGCFLHVLPK